jgi:hypothetical protein
MVPGQLMACHARAVAPVFAARGRSGAAQIACSNPWSGSGLIVLVNDAAEDIATSDDAAVRSGGSAGDRLGEL